MICLEGINKPSPEDKLSCGSQGYGSGRGVGHVRRLKLNGNLNLLDVSPIFMIFIGKEYKFTS